MSWGHSVTVMSVNPDSFYGPKDYSLDQLLSPSTNRIEVKSPENSLFFRALRLRESWFYRLFEPRKMEWLAPGKRALVALDAADYDVILSCSQPPVGHLLGLYMKRRSGLPWVAYFSDPWVNNPFRSYSSPRIKRHNSRLERLVVGLSEGLIFPSPEVRDLVMKGYSTRDRDKCEVLPHCYVLPWYKLGSEEVRENGKTKVLMTGNFYGPRTPLPFLSVLRDIMRNSDLANRLIVDIYGSISDEQLQYPIWRDLKDIVRFRGGIDYLSSLSKMKSADYLLLIDAETEDEGSIFFPSKLADYLGSGTVVVGLTPRNGVSARVLRQTGNVTCSVSDKEAMRTVVLKMIAGDLPRSKDERAVAQYDYGVVAKKLEGILRETRAV